MSSYWVKACGSPECQVTHDRFSDTVQYSKWHASAKSCRYYPVCAVTGWLSGEGLSAAPVWLYWVGTSFQQPSTLWSTQNTTHTVWTVIWSYRKRIKCVALCCKHSVPLHTLPKHTNTYTHWQLDTNNVCVCAHAHHAATVNSFRSILTHI